MSPALVAVVASARDDNTAAQAISAATKTLLIQDLPVIRTEHSNKWAEIVDVAQSSDHAWIVRREQVWDEDEYLESAPIMAEFQTVRLESHFVELDKLIRQALPIESQIIVPEVASVTKLDVIDTALYKALTENPELLRTLDWRVFEKLLADIFDRFGFEVELQQGTKDGGIDLFAVKKTHPLGPQRFLLQAKRWKNSVGVEPVRQLAFLHRHHGVTKILPRNDSNFHKGSMGPSSAIPLATGTTRFQWADGLGPRSRQNQKNSVEVDCGVSSAKSARVLERC